MKRKIFLILTVAMCLGGLMAGCGKSDEFPDEETIVEDDEEEDEEEEEVEEEPEEPAEEAEAPAEEAEAPAEEAEEPAEEAAPAEAAEPEEKKEAVEAEDYVLYDADGARVTFEKVKLDGSNNITPMLCLANDNPDNKKVTFELSSCYFNGINVSLSGSREAKAGDSNNKDISISSAMNEYTRVIGQLGETIETVPVETIDCYYRIRIGSDSEWVSDKVSLKTAQYKGGVYEKSYGNKIFEGEVGDAILEVYCRPAGDGTTVTVKNKADVDIQNWNANMNCQGKSFSCDWYNSSGVLRSNTAFFVHFNKTAQDIRSDYEIPNDEPLDLQLKFENRNNGSYNELYIPIDIPE